MRAVSVTVLALALSASAFPSMGKGMVGRDFGEAHTGESLSKRALIIPPPPLTPLGRKLIPDAAHPYQDPPAGAKRGPCPGLNLLANHGYISRDGVTTMAELYNGTQEAFNIGYDTTTVLVVYGTYVGGNVLSLGKQLSIGGPSSAVPPVTLLGPPPGGMSQHGKFEVDASLTREDIGITGDASTVNQTVFDNFTAHADTYGGGTYNFDAVAAYHPARYYHSLANNPTFYYGPIAFAIDNLAGSLFYLAMANDGSGATDKPTMASLVGGPTTPGRFPENWYRRSTPITLVDVVTEALNAYLAHPLPIFNGNGGSTTRNFANVNELGCYIYEVLVQEIIPNPLVPLVDTLLVLGNVFNGAFSCPIIPPP